MDVFGEYRSVLGRAPSGDVFEALLALHRAHPKLDAYIWHYIQDHLSRWPVGVERRLSFEGVEKLKSRLRRMTAQQLALYNGVRFDEDHHDLSDLVGVIKRMPHLVYLRAPYIPFDDASEEVIGEFWSHCMRLEQLRVLDLRYTELNDEMLKLLPVGKWRALEVLHVQHNPFGVEGVKCLIQSGALRKLKVLDLRHVSIQIEGARLLASHPDVANLEALYLYREDVTASGLMVLARSSHLAPALKSVFEARAAPM